MSPHRRQIGDEALGLGAPRLLVGRAEQRRGVDRRHDDRRELRGDELAAPLRHAERFPEQRLRRRRAQADDRARLHGLDLGQEPGHAGADLGGVRLRVDAALAARLPLEVLDRVGHVDGAAIDARLLEAAVEQPARRSDEGPALAVLVVARLLAHQHHAGARAALAEDGLGAALVEVARGAARGGGAQRRQGALAREERGGRAFVSLGLGHAGALVQPGPAVTGRSASRRTRRRAGARKRLPFARPRLHHAASEGPREASAPARDPHGGCE